MAKKEESCSCSCCSNNWGILSVVFAILSLAFSITIILGVLFGVLSIIFAIVQFSKNKNAWAWAGLIVSILGILASVGMAAFYAQSAKALMQACINNPNLEGCQQIISALGSSGAGVS